MHIPFQPPTLPTVTASKAKTEKSDGRHAWSLRGSTNTPSKFLAWKALQNCRQLRHQSNAAIRILSNSGGPESDSMICSSHSQAFPQTEATIAKAGIAEIETTSIRSKYAGKKAGAGPGGRKLIKGKLGDWELLKQKEMEERERTNLWLSELRQRLRERLVQEEVLAALPELREQHRKRNFAILRFCYVLNIR